MRQSHPMRACGEMLASGWAAAGRRCGEDMVGERMSQWTKIEANADLTMAPD
jgi:hypothetical protein